MFINSTSTISTLHKESMSQPLTFTLLFLICVSAMNIKPNTNDEYINISLSEYTKVIDNEWILNTNDTELSRVYVGLSFVYFLTTNANTI